MIVKDINGTIIIVIKPNRILITENAKNLTTICDFLTLNPCWFVKASLNVILPKVCPLEFKIGISKYVTDKPITTEIANAISCTVVTYLNGSLNTSDVCKFVKALL